jgi:hypothetical protein
MASSGGPFLGSAGWLGCGWRADLSGACCGAGTVSTARADWQHGEGWFSDELRGRAGQRPESLTGTLRRGRGCGPEAEAFPRGRSPGPADRHQIESLTTTEASPPTQVDVLHVRATTECMAASTPRLKLRGDARAEGSSMRSERGAASISWPATGHGPQDTADGSAQRRCTSLGAQAPSPSL